MGQWEWLGRWRVALTAAIAVAVLGAGSAGAAGTHRVMPGETLSEIADAYDLPMSSVARANQIVDYDLIFAGEVLTIPANPATTVPAAPDSTAAGSAYIVRSGDTLWTIASLRRTTLEQLIAVNPDILDPNHIIVDQTIRLPGSGTGTGRNSAGLTATVETPAVGDVPTLLTAYANRYGLDPNLIKALAWQESGWNQRMVSSSGALGVMQIMPATGAWIASDILGRRLDVANSAADNIDAGVAYLRYLIDQTGDVELGLAAYYQGPGSLNADGVHAATQRYIANVLAIRSYLVLYGVPPRG